MNAVKEVEVKCLRCQTDLLAVQTKDYQSKPCPSCGFPVMVPPPKLPPPRTFKEKFRAWDEERIYRKWQYNQMKNNGFNNATRDTIMAVGCCILLALLWVFLNVIMKAGNEPLGPRMGYDMTATTPVMVDNPDGTLSVEKVTVFTTTKGYTDREANTTVLIVFIIAGFMVFGCVYGTRK